MAKHERVVLADAAADSPSPFGTTAIALVALCTGFASAYALRDRDGDAHVAKSARSVHTDVLPATAAPHAPEGEPEAEPAPALAEPAAPAIEQAAAPSAAEPSLPTAPPTRPELARPAPPPEPPPAPAVAAVDAQRAEPSDQAEARAASTADPFADQRLKPGIVAYLRCDGLPQRNGPFPCPRDRDLERHVWHTLRSLERCAPLVDAHGAGEVRLELTPSRTELHVVSGELDRIAVRQCAAGLTSARTALRPERMIVAFRFKLH